MFDEQFCSRLQALLQANRPFAMQTRVFDGSILLEDSGGRCWLKVYCGQVIDARVQVPPFGYTFKLTGTDAAWRLLVDGDRRFVDLITGGARYFEHVEEADNSEPAQLRLEGDLVAAARLHESLFYLADSVIEAAGGSHG